MRRSGYEPLDVLLVELLVPLVCVPPVPESELLVF
jgi:hypothetical protein